MYVYLSLLSDFYAAKIENKSVKRAILQLFITLKRAILQIFDF